MIKRNEDFKYQRITPKISAYLTTYNALNLGYPVEESIRSTFGFADETVIVDGISTDKTWELLQNIAKENSNLKLYQNEFDLSEAGVDGIQKASARALCEYEFCWQQDIDEVVHEDDYEKIKLLTKRFPKDVDILHLPIIELWSTENYVTGRKNCWKWRLSRNKSEITHGICSHARLTNEVTGKIYSTKNCDGCCLINVMTGQPISHVGFYNNQIESMRVHEPEQYAKTVTQIFEQLPSIFHYSWYNLENKIKQLKKGGNWCKLWMLLYNSLEPEERFPAVQSDEQVKEVAKKLFEFGGEETDSTKYKFKLQRKHPKVMEKWIERQKW